MIIYYTKVIKVTFAGTSGLGFGADPAMQAPNAQRNVTRNETYCKQLIRPNFLFIQWLSLLHCVCSIQKLPVIVHTDQQFLRSNSIHLCRSWPPCLCFTNIPVVQLNRILRNFLPKNCYLLLIYNDIDLVLNLIIYQVHYSGHIRTTKLITRLWFDGYTLCKRPCNFISLRELEECALSCRQAHYDAKCRKVHMVASWASLITRFV